MYNDAKAIFLNKLRDDGYDREYILYIDCRTRFFVPYVPKPKLPRQVSANSSTVRAVLPMHPVWLLQNKLPRSLRVHFQDPWMQECWRDCTKSDTSLECSLSWKLTAASHDLKIRSESGW